MSETTIVILLITLGLIIGIDLLFIACCLVLNSRIEKEEK